MAQKRNICLINDSFPPAIDGVASAVVNYAGEIQKHYGRATVVTPYYPDADDSAFPFPVVRYPSLDVTKLVGYRAGVPLSPELLRRLDEGRFDLIHTHCPVSSTILARMLRERLNVPVVFTYHTKFDVDIANAMHNKLLQETSIKLLVDNISACDEVWTVSRGAGENLRSLGFRGRYRIMHNGVDFPAGRLPEAAVRGVGKGLDLPEGVPVLLFVGRIMWYKGLKIILDALKALQIEGRPFRMVFVGRGTDETEVRAYARKLGLTKQVFFLPPVYDRGIIRAWYCRADLFLFPSTFDTNGLVVREAAACGLASVLIAGSCAAEDVTNGRNGFLIRENAASMAAMLRRLLADLPLVRRVGENAQRELYLSWESAVANACRRYEAVLENFKAGRYPPRRALSETLLKGTAGSLEAIGSVKDLSQQVYRSVDNGVRQLQESPWVQENYRLLREKMAQLRQRLDRYL